MRLPASPSSLRDGVRADLGPLIPVFAALLLFFFSSSNGIVSTADGSSYQLTQAIVDQGRLEVDPRLHLTIWPTSITFENANDVAIYQSRRYSDRPPGTGLAAIPFYLLGRLAGWLRSAAPDPRVLELSATLLSCTASALTVILAYRAARALGARADASSWMALALTAGSLFWKYAGTLYTHALSACLLTGLVLMAMREAAPRGNAAPAALPSPISHLSSLKAGALIGAATLVEYQNLVLALPMVALLAWRRRLTWTAVGLAALGGLAVGWVLPVYNWVAFDSPFSLSYAHQANSPWDQGFSGGFAPPPPIAIYGLLLGGVSPMRGGPAVSGLLQNSPTLALSAWGLLRLVRRGRGPEALALAAMGALSLGVAASFRSWWGDLDARYVLGVVPALFVPMAIWLDEVARPWFLLRVGFAAGLGASLLDSGALLWRLYTHFGRAGGQPFSFYRADHGLAAVDALFPNLWNAGLPLALLSPLALAWAARRLPLGARGVGLGAALGLGVALLGLRLFTYTSPGYARPTQLPLTGFDPPNPLHASLGATVELLGYRLAPASRDSPSRLTLFWRAVSAPPADYTLFARVYDAANQPIVTVDLPAGAPAFPSRAWPLDRVVVQPVALDLPAHTPAGHYRVDVGLYEGDGHRLPAHDPAGHRLPGDAITLGPLELR